MKKFLFSTMLVATSIGGFSQTVWSKTLMGQTDWMVRKVSAETPYCTVTRQFQANAVLTLARNARGEGTVALDFQRNAFDVTRPYPVILEVGNIKREYAVKPAVANVVILRVGTDTDLFEAMTNSNVLHVTIDNETFAMDLGDYSHAYADLNECIGVQQLPKPQVAQQAKPQPQPVVAPQMSAEETARMDTLLAENKRLTQELMKRDQEQQQVLQQNMGNASAEKEQLVQKLVEAEQKNAQLLAQMEQLELDLQASRQSLNPDMSKTIQDRDDQIARLVQQNESLQMALADAKERLEMASSNLGKDSAEMRIKMSELEAQAAQFKAERDQYKTELQQKTQAMTELQSRAPELESEVAKIKAERDRYQSELQQKSQAMTQLESRSPELEAEISRLRAERDRYQSELQEKSQAMTQLQSRSPELEAEISRLRAERDRYQSELQQKTQQLVELQSREPEVVIKEVIKEVPASLNPMNAIPDADISLRLAKIETEAQTYKAERDEYQRLLQQERQKIVEEAAPEDNTNMIAEIQKLEAEKADLARQLAFAKTTQPEPAPMVNNDKTAALEGRLRDMEDRLTAMAMEKAQLEDRLATAQTAEKPSSDNGQQQQMMQARLKDMEEIVSRTNEEKSRLEAQLENTRIKLNQREQQSQEYDIVVARLQDMEDKVQRMNQEKAIIEGKLGAAQSGMDEGSKAQENEMNALRKRMGDLQTQVAMLNDEKGQLKQELDAARDASSGDTNAQAQMAQATQRAVEMERQLMQMSQENENLQKQVQMAQQKAQMTAKQMAQSAVAQLSTPNTTADDVKTLESEIAALEAQNSVLRKDVNHYKKSSEDQAKMAIVQQRARSYPEGTGANQPAIKNRAVQATPLRGTVQPIPRVELTGNEIKQIVARAQLPLVTNVDRIDRVSGPNFAAFRWDTGTVYGSGEQSRLPNTLAFEDAVQGYINKTKSRCTGSFDQTVTDRVVDGIGVKVADIACVDAGANGVAASILFFVHRGVFYALAHEADMNTFQTAMDMRDKLANSIGAIF